MKKTENHGSGTVNVEQRKSTSINFKLLVQPHQHLLMVGHLRLTQPQV